MSVNILVVDDEKLICWSLKKDLEKKNFNVQTALCAKEVFQHLDSESPQIVLLDIQLPDGNGVELLNEIKRKNPLSQVIMITANDQIETAVECMKKGAFHYLHKPFHFEEIYVLIEKALEYQEMQRQIHRWQTHKKSKYPFENIIGDHAVMIQVKELVRKVAQSEAKTVLLLGESGVGKDLIARTIHYAGPNTQRPFVTVNCAAVPATLLESELFGHEKGAFTDARQMKRGLAEEASGGTLFLDEIGDMPHEMQAKLLHLIENRKFRRIGSAVERDSDLRIIAATNRDLKKQVEAGAFREDLFYRLNVIPIKLPALREHKEDLAALVNCFIGHFNREFHKEVTAIDPEAFEILQMYDWPGNVRELRNVIERAIILNQETTIRRHHLPAEIDCRCTMAATYKQSVSEEPSSSLPHCLTGVPLEAIEKNAILLAMEQCEGNQTKAAALLGIGRDALRYKMQKYQMTPPLNSDSTA